MKTKNNTLDKRQKKAVVLFSGGLDSTVVLSLSVIEYGAENVIALTINYGQKHNKEVLAAKRIADFYGTEHIVIDLSKIFAFGGSSLLSGGDSIEDGEYKTQTKTNGLLDTYVPFRNGLMLSAAASIALAKNASVLLYGAHCDDAAAAYPDCSKEFFDAFKSSVFLGSGKNLSLLAPFIDKQKADIVAAGLNNSVPFDLTWSCYKGGDKPCGSCATCLDRAKAFAKNGATDPLVGD